jgi:hypothetical protein
MQQIYFLFFTREYPIPKGIENALGCTAHTKSKKQKIHLLNKKSKGLIGL